MHQRKEGAAIFRILSFQEESAFEVDLLNVKLTKVITRIVMFKADVLTNVSRPGRF